MNKLSNAQPNRKSNFELLRIFAMFLIIAHHFAVHSGFNFSVILAPNYITFNRIWVKFLSLGGKIGVNLFILTSGYFLSTQKVFSLKKVLKLHFPILFYSIAYLIFFSLRGYKYLYTDYLRSFFPVIYGRWWFASCYIALFLFIPFINKMLMSLTKRQFSALILIMTVCFCLVPTFFGQRYQTNELLLMLYIYIIAAYIRYFYSECSFSFIKLFISAFFIAIATVCCSVVLDHISWKKNGLFAMNNSDLFGMDRLPILLISLTIFLAFKSLKVSYLPLINYISATTFGIYLVHDHELARGFIWGEIFKTTTYQHNIYLIPYSIVCIFAVFFACFIIERLRILIFDKLLSNPIDFISQKLTSLFNKIVDMLTKDRILSKRK